MKKIKIDNGDSYPYYFCYTNVGDVEFDYIHPISYSDIVRFIYETMPINMIIDAEYIAKKSLPSGK